MLNRAESHRSVGAVIIGAGFAGLYMLHQLRDIVGIDAVVVEAEPDVGGTWYLNCYPGARCDTDSYVYCYSFSEDLLREWTYSSKYPRQDEILSYLRYVADKFDLRRSISFDSAVVGADWDASTRSWTVRTANAVYAAKYLITAVGLLAATPYTPDIPGISTFTGEVFHTGRWPRESVDLRGRRVGVIGTGSTGTQVVTELAVAGVSQLYVFQRTPQYIIPGRSENMTEAALAEIRRNYDRIWKIAKWSAAGFPWQHNGRSALAESASDRLAEFERLWQEGGFRFLFNSYRDLVTNREANDIVSDFVRSKMLERVDNAATGIKLVPNNHGIGSRRPIINDGYLDAFNQSNVHLVDLAESPIKRFTESSVQTADATYGLDTVIFATGFDSVTGPMLKVGIRGRNGVMLADKWKDGPRSYLGLAVSGFPNMFAITGPGSTFGNMPVAIEHHVEWIAQLIAKAEGGAVVTIEATVDAENDWNARVIESASRVLPSVKSWWTGENIPGKPKSVLFYLGNFGHYRRICKEIAEDSYSGFAFDPVSAGVSAHSDREKAS